MRPGQVYGSVLASWPEDAARLARYGLEVDGLVVQVYASSSTRRRELLGECELSVSLLGPCVMWRQLSPMDHDQLEALVSGQRAFLTSFE